MRVTTGFNRILTCPCGWRTRSRYDTSRRRWRQLDFGACKVFLEADLHRLDCHGCGRSARNGCRGRGPVPAHPRLRGPGRLAQRMDNTSVARLLRCSWEAVDGIVTRVVADNIDDTRLDGLCRIGVDEISYKRGHRCLTIIPSKWR